MRESRRRAGNQSATWRDRSERRRDMLGSIGRMISTRQSCAFPYCSGRAERGGYCLTHARSENRRPSRQALGYDAVWYRFRAWFLRDHPLCGDCAESGRVNPATQVHHEKPLRDYPELRLEPKNCRALCASCHTIRENLRKFPK